MHLLVLGGTGQCGQIFVSDALQSGHRITLYARNPSKFSQSVVENPNVNIVKGEFSDVEAIKSALGKGAEILVSFVGPNVPCRGMAITNFYETLFGLLPTESSIRRCLILSTASYKAPGERYGLMWWFGVTLIWLFCGSAYAEINGLSKATTSLSSKGIEWTLYRVPGLTNGTAAPVRAGGLGSKADGLILSRKSLPPWILQELQERKWIDKALCLSNEGWNRWV